MPTNFWIIKVKRLLFSQLGDDARKLMAAIFILSGTFFGSIFIFWVCQFLHVENTLLLAGVPFLLLFSLTLSAYFIFNSFGVRKIRKFQPPATEELESRGLIVREKFSATAAFISQNHPEDCPAYLIELSSGDILYLEGDYLF